jgi:hypothetical protein
MVHPGTRPDILLLRPKHSRHRASCRQRPLAGLGRFNDQNGDGIAVGPLVESRVDHPERPSPDGDRVAGLP